MPIITIDLTAAQAQRLAPAFKEETGIPEGAGAPTIADVKAYLIDHLKTMVRQYERREAMKAAVSGIADPTAFDPH